MFIVSRSPRIGTNAESYGQIIIRQNDNANGILELSATRVEVAENHTGPVLQVIRHGGQIGQVNKT